MWEYGRTKYHENYFRYKSKKIYIYFFKKINIYIYIFFFFFFWLHRVACGILVPQPGIEPVPSAVKVQGPNHWTVREFPLVCVFNLEFIQQFLQQVELKAGLGSCSACATLLHKGRDSFIQTQDKSIFHLTEIFVRRHSTHPAPCLELSRNKRGENEMQPLPIWAYDLRGETRYANH